MTQRDSTLVTVTTVALFETIFFTIRIHLFKFCVLCSYQMCVMNKICFTDFSQGRVFHQFLSMII